MITCRDLTKCAVKQGKYMLVTAPDGGIVNDPVLLHVDENTLVDAARRLRRRAVRPRGRSRRAGLDAEVTLPDVHPMQVQGPMSAKTLEKLVGSAIYDIKYYWCEASRSTASRCVISRTGWTAIPGFEVNLLDGSRGDDLWNAVVAAGEEFGIRPIAPCEARRIEAGSSTTARTSASSDTPFHVMGLERLVEEQPQDYVGKAALEELRTKGVDRKLVGIEIEGDELRAEMSQYWDASSGGKKVGHMTDAVWSPGPQEEHRLRLGPDRPRGARQRARDPRRGRRHPSPAPRPRSRSSTRRRSGPPAKLQ